MTYGLCIAIPVSRSQWKNVVYNMVVNLTFVKRKKEARNTYSFFFKPDKKLKFLPGQFIYIELPKLSAPDSKGPVRHFTISSPPQEKNLRITTRIRDESLYKQTLMKLKKGEVVIAGGIDGSFIFDEREKGEHIFVAGGIGITPFMSHLEYAQKKGLTAQVQLAYYNKKPDLITFKKKLDELTKKMKKLKVDFFVTQPEGTHWSGHSARISPEYLPMLVKDFQSKKYWVSGPPKMVSSVLSTLRKLKIDSSNVRFEKFSGY